jgi:glycosyltransferase involved in cell wall biosynthesis
MSLVTIITPTYKASPFTLQRCLNSVQRQTVKDFTHIICSDGESEPDVLRVVLGYNDQRLHYKWTNTHHGDYGHSIRQVLLPEITSKYLMFLDDDNFIFPYYLESMLDSLAKYPQGRFTICGLLHYGPLLAELGEPPVVLYGEPKVGYIDTLQVLMETALLQEVGWVANDYAADGWTYEAMAKVAKFSRVPEVLGVHS